MSKNIVSSEFYRGFGMAVASVARAGKDTDAWNAMETNGVKPSDLLGCGLMDFDMKEIKRISKYFLRRRRALRSLGKRSMSLREIYRRGDAASNSVRSSKGDDRG